MSRTEMWRGRRGRAALCLSLVVLAGCPPEDDDDDFPPRVLGVEPAVPVVPVQVSFEVRFSEAMNPRTVSTDPAADNFSILLAPRDKVTDAFLSDFRNPPLSASRHDDLVPISVALVRGDEALSITPQSPLAPRTAYRLIVSGEVRDTAGNPLVDANGTKAPFMWDFSTDAGAPEVIATDLPRGGSFVVPNRRRFNVTFNQPVQNVTDETLRITGPTVPVVDAILIDEARVNATILLGAGGAGCERLAASSTYTLSANSAIVADTGQALLPFTRDFTVGPSCDTSANSIVDATAIAGEIDAVVRFSSTKPSTTELRFGVAGAALDCLGAPCPVAGAFAGTPSGGNNPTFLHTVALGGLALGVTYAFVAIAEDEVGFVARREGTFVTAPLPKIAINEYLANPVDTDEPGEFIELKSYEESLTHEVGGWVLSKVGGNGQPVTCTLPGGVAIAPGGFLLLTTSTFNGELFGGVDDAIVVRMGGRLCGGLLNDAPTILELHDPSGRPISTASAAIRPVEGRSIERIAPSAPDVADSFCFSRRDVGPTPGEDNGVIARGCD